MAQGRALRHHGGICEVSLATLIQGEITQVTSLMRKNARWAGASATSTPVPSSSSNSGRVGTSTTSTTSDGPSRTSSPLVPRTTDASSSVSTSGTSVSSSSTATPSGLSGPDEASDRGATTTVSDTSNPGFVKDIAVRNSQNKGVARGAVGPSKQSATAAAAAAAAVAGAAGSKSNNQQQSLPRPAGTLMSGFATLKAEIQQIDDLANLDALLLLSPFLDVVRSGDTSGPITAIALSSVDKFISYKLVHRDSPNLSAAITSVAGAGTHCKFEASDSISDEIVLLKILDVLRNTLTSELGDVLSDEAVCEMMETGLSMCCQMRLSEMLRRSAERTMQAMIISVFRRLQTLSVPSEETPQPHLSDAAQHPPSSSSEPVADVASTQLADETQQLRMNAPDPTSGSIPAASTPSHDAPTAPAVTRHTSSLSVSGAIPQATPGNATVYGDVEREQEIQPEFRPYGLPSIREILRVLISLLNPHDQQHTDSMRLMALGLLNVAFEVGGRSIGHFPVLRAMVADELCKYLFQLARSENPLLLSTSLRVIANIFDTMREHLKLQQELFLSFLMDRLIRPGSLNGARKGEVESVLDASTWNADYSLTSKSDERERRGSGTLSQSTGPSGGRHQTLPGSEGRDLMLEYLAQFAKAPDFMTNLWVNYDCNVDCEDLFERLIKFFSRGVYPTQGSHQYLQDSSQLVCLDTLLNFVDSLTARLDDAEEESSGGGLDAAALSHAKSNKRHLLEGAVRFNEKPKDGIAFLESKGLIYTDENADEPRPKVLAKFLKNSPRLDKKLLGDYISRPGNVEVLRAFIGLFDFRDKVISDAMRELLESFRLPGEAQQIDRITEVFSQVYVAANSNAEIKSSEAAYVLAFSIIMLNTDQHSPQVRKKMTLEDYSRNLKGVNDKADFAPEYIKAIYDGIRKREIVMPEEQYGQVGFEYAWKELLRRTRDAGPFVICNTAQFDKSIFTLAWKPVISALSYAFTHFTDDYMLQRAISGFQQCASLANRFGLPEVFDYIIHSLSKITGLPASQLPTESTVTFPTIDIDGQSITVSTLALRFGTSFKAQLAAVVLFSIANANTASIKMSWIDIFEIYQTFFTHSLLPQSLLNMAEFLAGTPAIPLKVRVKAAVQEEKRRNDGGLLSTLSSYLLSPYANGAEGIGRDITDDDVEHTLSTIDCIASCRVDSLYRAIIALPPDAMSAAMHGLVDLNERLTLDKIRQRPPSSLATNPPSPIVSRQQVPYDPSTVFMLEFMMSIAGEAEAAAHETWPIIFEFVSKLLQSAASFHHILLERAVTGLLRLASVVARKDDLRDQVFLALDLLRSLPQPMTSTLAEQIATGLSRILMENPNAVRSSTEWNLVYALWSATASKEEAAVVSFDLISQLAQGRLGGGLHAENFTGFIKVLNDFASVAGAGDVRYRNSPAGVNDAVVIRGRYALDMIRDAQSMANDLIAASTMSVPAAWESYWLPVLSAYSQQSVNGCREIRQTALASLQRTLIAYEVLSNAEIDLIMIFERLIFPMLDELLKPQVFRRDPEGMGETRLRASTLLCKIFLHYLIQLSERQGIAGMTELWMKILGYLDRFMHSGRRDQMYEAVPESLKNVLLVMHASGFLVPPHQTPRSEEQANLWDATFDRLDIFLPSLRQDLFPAPVSTNRPSQLALQPQPHRSPSPSGSFAIAGDADKSSGGRDEDRQKEASGQSLSQSLSTYL